MDDEKRVHHQSGLNQFEFCGWNYFLEQIEGRRGRVNLYLARGRGVHTSREVNFVQKIESGEDLPVGDLEDACVDEITRTCDDEDISFTDELDGLSKGGARDRIIRSTLPMVRIDRELLMPKVQPLYVEKYLQVELPGYPFDIAGKLDVIDTQEIVIDTKSSINKWTQEKVDEAYQATHYWLMARAFLGHDPKSFRYHILVETKAGKRFAYVLETTRGEKQIKAVMLRYEAMNHAIDTGIFLPTHQGNWKCSPKWCGQYAACKYVQR